MAKTFKDQIKKIYSKDSMPRLEEALKSARERFRNSSHEQDAQRCEAIYELIEERKNAQ